MTLIAIAPVNIVHIAYVSMSLFSILLVFGKKPYKALVLLLAMHLIQEIFNPLEELHVIHYLITPAIQLALGPLYYLFVKNLIFGNIDIRRHLIHFLPTLIALLFTRWWPIELMLAFFILIIYFYFTLKLIHNYHKLLKDNLVNDGHYSLNWLRQTFAVIAAVEFIDFIRLNLQLVLHSDILIRWYFISALISLLCTAYLVLCAVRKPSLYEGISKLQKTEDETKDSRLAASLFSAIIDHQRQHLSYRRPKYGLRDLAEEIGLTEQNVSWAINQGGGKSFSGFINELRIEEVKHFITTSAGNQNFLDMAFNAGFNSKSTFNAVFKQHTGMTPSQYEKSLKI